MSNIGFDEMLINNLKEENKQLKQQLAEKDRELYLTKDTLKHHTNIYNSLVEHRNQDKISFCIEKFEWLKEKVDNAKIHEINMINTHELYEILDNQIASLKKGVE